MTALRFVERVQTIAATAVLTSAVWIVVGSVYFVREGRDPGAPAPTTERAAAARGNPQPEAQLLIPVRGVSPRELTDTFADDRGGRRHEAVDIMAPAGTPVVAAAPGTVEKLFRSAAGGNTIYVRSPDRRTVYYYAHLQRYAAGLTEGQTVERGDELGIVGSSGNADPGAPHLHFAVWRSNPTAGWWETGKAVDPYPLLTP